MGDVRAVLFDCDEPFDGVVAQDIGDFTETLNTFPPKTPVFLYLRGIDESSEE